MELTPTWQILRDEIKDAIKKLRSEVWKLTLYRKVLYEIVGGALTFGDIIDRMRNE